MSITEIISKVSDKGAFENVAPPSEPQEPAKSRAGRRQLRPSTFLLTINTNQIFHDLDDAEFKELHEKMKTLMKSLFCSNIMNYIKFLEDDCDGRYIKKIEQKAFPEIGDKKHNYHWHVALHVEHYTKIQLDIDKLKRTIKEAIPGSYLNVKSIREKYEGFQTVKKYITKNQN